MAEPNKSPAVQSYNADKTRQQSTADALDQGLEDTFPASDPVSATQPSVASTIDRSPANADEYPLVDEALKSTGEFGGDESGLGARSLRRDAARLSGQATDVASGALALGKSEAKSVLRSLEGIVRERPLAALGIVAAVAWVRGATR